jgi:hypothetical protein
MAGAADIHLAGQELVTVVHPQKHVVLRVEAVEDLVSSFSMLLRALPV